MLYFCVSYCREFSKLLSEIDNELMEDIFDMVIVTALTDKEYEKNIPKKIYIDQVDL